MICQYVYLLINLGSQNEHRLKLFESKTHTHTHKQEQNISVVMKYNMHQPQIIFSHKKKLLLTFSALSSDSHCSMMYTIRPPVQFKVRSLLVGSIVESVFRVFSMALRYDFCEKRKKSELINDCLELSQERNTRVIELWMCVTFASNNISTGSFAILFNMFWAFYKKNKENNVKQLPDMYVCIYAMTKRFKKRKHWPKGRPSKLFLV